jgi:NAD(P)-dependent dehydrogenase (short-subunit alcohol dehydrogenase family)
LDRAKNFFGLRFWGAVAAAKHGSTLPRRPLAGWAIGASISSAVEGLARGLAVELAPVRVNVVAPGIVRTPLWNWLPEEQREAFFETRGAGLPVGKVGEPAETAAAYLFLMSATSTTGQTVVVDGGMLLV